MSNRKSARNRYRWNSSLWAWASWGLRWSLVLCITFVLVCGTTVTWAQNGEGLDGDEHFEAIQYQSYGQPQDLAELVVVDGVPEYQVKLSDEQMPHLELWYDTLWRFFKRGPIAYTRKGTSRLGTRFDVISITSVVNPAEQDWSCTASYRAWFNILCSNTFGLSASSSSADIKDKVRTSRFSRECVVFIDYVAAEKTIYVNIYNLKTGDLGPEYLTGEYLVNAKKTIKSTSKSTKVDVSASHKPKTEDVEFSFDVDTRKSSGITRLQTTVVGSRFVATFCRFMALETIRVDGSRQIEFNFLSDWDSTSDLSLQQTVVTDVLNCTRAIRSNFKWTDVLFGAAGSHEETACAGSSSASTASVRWYCRPTVDGDVGFMSESRFFTASDAFGGGEGYYQPRYWADVIWDLSVNAGSGGGMNVSIKGRPGAQTKKKVYRTVID